LYSATTTGEVVNLISADIQNANQLTFALVDMVCTPITVGAILYFLYATIGPSAFLGIAVLFTGMPILVVSINYLMYYQVRVFPFLVADNRSSCSCCRTRS
jgi:hypothetical protein